MSAYFVTGSGTEIGKTYVSAAILTAARAQGRSVSPVKPLMSGFSAGELGASDAGILAAACGLQPTPETIGDICLHSFEPPLAPNVAAREAGVKIDEDRLIHFAKERIPPPPALTLVEGAGGVMSPATDTLLQLDLAVRLELPAILVTASYLGAVSHTLSAVAALENAGVPIAAIVISQPRADEGDPDEFLPELARWCDHRLIPAAHGADPAMLGERILRALTAFEGEPAPAPAAVIDARGYRCPIPVIKLEAALRRLPADGEITILADDPVAAVDIPHFCREAGFQAKRQPDQGETGEICVFRVARADKIAG